MNLQTNVSLADKNWFGTGGAAELYSEPTTAQELSDVIVFARQQGHKITLLGEGANILISDAGVRGLVIRPGLKAILVDHEQGTVTAGAGVSFPDLILACLDARLLGLEEFAGIPGSVGGAVYINIHYFSFLLSHFLVQATVVDAFTGALQTVDAAWFNFGYDQSTLMAKNYYLVDATFQLKKCSELDAAYARGRHDEIIRHRRQRYPYARTCGSFFRNFLPEEITQEIQGKKIPFVAYYLDKIGVKGALFVGGASVSHQHANMIVTADGATSADVVALAKSMQQLVHTQYGLTPQPECQLLGFDTDPFER